MAIYPQRFKDLAILEMRVRPTVIKQWAEQNEDGELKKLASMVLDAAAQKAEAAQ